jgi:hypothetical protein
VALYERLRWGSRNIYVGCSIGITVGNILDHVENGEGATILCNMTRYLERFTGGELIIENFELGVCVNQAVWPRDLMQSKKFGGGTLRDGTQRTTGLG